jgi:histone H3/H4
MSANLVVVSKLKAYIKEKAGMNTSASAIDAMSIAIEKLADSAIAKALADGRKTVKDRDIIAPGADSCCCGG